MKYKNMLGASRTHVVMGIVLWGFITPWAVAGPEQDNEQAEKEFARGDLVVSLALWTKAAQQGYAPAQVRLGDILDKAEEDELAADWYRKAAVQGNHDGEYGLGQMYAKGEGVKKDLEQARTHILRAADKGNLSAVTVMMMAYRTGDLGLAVDPAQADAWEAKLISISPSYKKDSVKGEVKVKKVEVK